MIAPPSGVHQEVCFELRRQLGNFLVGKKCRVCPAPFGVRLFEKDGDRPENVDTMAEPDTQTVQVYALENGILHPCAFYGQTDAAKVNVLEGCFIELSKGFPAE
ncbi:MAG: Uma2 family endonuclease [Oscillibacter sp.]|nr:Uma2 family endonuclease [Oscillibacter sp.]